jgi:hypothetical protein
VLEALRIMNRHWRQEGGYTSPNLETYPWQWLWDSCFHTLVWGAAGDERAVIELQNVFLHQHPSGFVPHMGYQLDPDAARDLWGVAGSSTITQPPMYGHAARRLAEWGYHLTPELLELIERAFDFLWTKRRAPNGLVSCVHPWEGGTDDSPRWDAWTARPFDRFGTWQSRNLELLAALELDEEGASIGSPEFVVQPAGFNALVAFNMLEFDQLTGSSLWRKRAGELAEALEEQWMPELDTWTDAARGDPISTRVRTLEALLGILVSTDRGRQETVWRELFDPEAFGAPYGPCGVHRQEPTFEPDAYWRGAAWPQLNYLFWEAARRQGRQEEARRLAEQTRRAAQSSGHAEYWNPDTAEGRGAAPQSWSTLWVIMD